LELRDRRERKREKEKETTSKISTLGVPRRIYIGGGL